ncbi:MAG: WD40/YVTN/BNR-like repeat-containing protein [Synechococcus sp.]
MNVSRIASTVVLSLAMLLTLASGASFAHAPHDDIQLLEVSANYSNDKTLFVSVRENLLRSSDGGENFRRVVNGLDYTRGLNDLESSEANESTFYLATSGNGIFKSEDKGNSWFRVNSGLENLDIYKLAVSPTDSDFVLAVGEDHTLYRSRNGGNTWITVSDAPHVTAVEYAPKGNSDIFLGDELGNLYMSLDGMDSWTELSSPENVGAISGIVISSNYSEDNKGFIYTTEGGVFEGDMADGPVWQPINTGLSNQVLMSMVQQPDSSNEFSFLASSSPEGVVRFTSSQGSWEPFGQGLTTHTQANRKGRPHFTELVLVNDFENNKTAFLAGYDGLFKSVDGGQSWNQLYTLNLDIIAGLSFSPTFSEDRTLAVSSYLSGSYLSQDLGQTWTYSHKGLAQARLEPGIARLFDIAFSPDFAADGRIYAIQENNLLISDNLGKSWRRSPLANNYLGFRKILNSAWSKIPVIGSKDLFTVYFPTQLAFSPNYQQDRTLFIGAREGSIFRSLDGGESIEKISALSKRINSIALSPNFSVDRKVFALDNGEKLYESNDAGESWQPVDFVADSDPLLFYVVTTPAGSSPEGETFLATSKGLYKRTGEESPWELLTGAGLDDSSYIQEVAVSPNFAEDRTLIASVRGKGTFKSIDAGESFSKIAEDLFEDNYGFASYYSFPSTALTLKFSPTYSEDRTIVGSTGRDLFVSQDEGETWSRLDFQAAPQSFSWFLFGYLLLKETLFLQLFLALLLALIGYFLSSYFLRNRKFNGTQLFAIRFAVAVTLFWVPIAILSF